MQQGKPTLVVQTVYFEPDERAPAERLGRALYDHLTRDAQQKLGFGPGIPVRVAVRAPHVDTNEAEHVVLVPMLGVKACQNVDARERTLKALAEWETQLDPNGLVLPLLLTSAWNRVTDNLPGARSLSEHEAPDGLERVVLAIVTEICGRITAFEKGPTPTIFVSHAESETAGIAKQIREIAVTSASHFQTIEPRQELSRKKRLEFAAKASLFIAVHSDQYSSRHQCQLELLTAKRSDAATLSVEILRQGEGRSYPYAGNGPTTVWVDQVPLEASARRVVLKALIEWLRVRHFLREAPRQLDGLPVAKTLARPPELLDLAQGPLLEQLSSVVFHPDPELSYAEREVLRAARQRLRLVTPSTRYRNLDGLGGIGAPLARAALRGKQVALSVSDVVDDLHQDRGLRPYHLDDAVVQLTRALVGAGAAIAYGGDFRRSGYDEVFTEIIAEYNASGVDQSQFLYSYLPAFFKEQQIPKDLPANIQALGSPGSAGDQALLKAPTEPPTRARAALFLSDMRRVMARACFARVMVGGQALPRANGSDVGFGGPFSGTIEEAWFTLGCHDPAAQEAKPLYVVGGFGGAAGLVAALPFTADLPPLLRPDAFADETYSEFEQCALDFEHDPDRSKIGAAANRQVLAEGIRTALQKLLANDETTRAWNGLSVEENKELFQSRDMVRVSSLVMKGLFGVLALRSSGKLAVELVHGDIVDVEGADLVALSTLRDVNIDGAGKALDAALSGLVSQAKRDNSSLLQLESPQVDAKWLALADLGRFRLDELEKARLPQDIEDKASEVARLAIRNDFRRLAVVTFGGTLRHQTPEVPILRMLKGFHALAGGATVQWFETNDIRFKRLREVLSAQPDVSLTISEARPLPVIAPKRASNDAYLFVRRSKGELQSTLLLPGGTAMSPEHVVMLSDQQLSSLNRTDAQGALDFDAVAAIGRAVTDLVLGPQGQELLLKEEIERLVIQHDVDSAAIPFEALSLGGKQPALPKGIVRRPSHRDLSLSDRPLKPAHVANLKLAVVVGSTAGLARAPIEASEIQRALADSDIDVTELPQATRQQVLDALRDPSVDILHFVGHAFFERLDGKGNGLECVDGPLTLDDIRGQPIEPRIIFFNACESVRIRGQAVAVPQAARAVAEYVLLSGVDAFVGTFWPVGDQAAADFSVQVYRQLAQGAQLTDAVASARQFLFDAKRKDWANYALYGNGSFRLKEPTNQLDAEKIDG